MSNPVSPWGGIIVRLSFALGGALALGMALLTILIYVGWLFQPDNPDAGQLGSLGFVIALPVGFVIGYLVAKQKRIRRVFLAASIGAFVGGMVGGHAAALLVSIGQQVRLLPPDGNSAGGPARALLGLLFTVAGLGVGWFVAARWPKSRAAAPNHITTAPKA